MKHSPPLQGSHVKKLRVVGFCAVVAVGLLAVVGGWRTDDDDQPYVR